MERNYWQEYWDNYCKFMAVYLTELQNAYPDADIKNEYVEVANLFEPAMPLEYYENFDEYEDIDNDPERENDPPVGVQSIAPFIFPGGGQQSPTPFISPGGGQFTINNCRRMVIVRIEMRRGFTPSSFFMVVDRADNRSIQGFRIACESGRIRFVPMAVEYRNINFIECAF
ncbi:hypothetical protein [Paraclostridium sordellii]|uniref:Uncharacterized protein n=1 Tax=Paraclostridium sordellii TaxID=1505 RepID=A0A0C7R610_PARSO|nr:hypothetical protein [Paeniclostridium sordellii]CEN78468.1 Uncharacterised protein [[Clostridium] sordellii] [Paeniclostridium sordellii]CEQ03564.1 Uncharacterised protein [[Clostridium] sordellii] [Paeniclostridium sordellii]